MYASTDRHPNFNAGTAGQVIAFFASKQHDLKISKLKVIKLAYLADRESIKAQGEPIIYDRKFSLDHGPVNSATLNLIDGNGSSTHLQAFRVFANRENTHTVKASRAFEREDFDELSDSDLQVLEIIWARHGSKNATQLRNWTHVKANVPEYTEPPKGSRTAITLESIYNEVGANLEALVDLEALQYAERVLKTG